MFLNAGTPGLCPLGGGEVRLGVWEVASEFDLPANTANRDAALLRVSADVSAQGA